MIEQFQKRILIENPDWRIGVDITTGTVYLSLGHAEDHMTAHMHPDLVKKLCSELMTAAKALELVDDAELS